MGVRGLTTYIAENADRYLDPLELHDCNLVIDGDSLSSNLYKKCNSAFGGNYDHYFRIVCNFFEMLQQCNITSYVLLDGGYMVKKLNTVRNRLRAKIGAIKHMNPFDCQPMFPIMMREVFVEAMQHCNVKFMRCIFEADDEVAALSRKLKCPLLSYDSDFYIHNVIYIPSVTLTLKVYRRNIPVENSKQKVRQRKELIHEMDPSGECFKFKAKKVNEDSASPEKRCYYYMQCSVYRIRNLAKDRHIRAEMLPLFAVLLGNDYISRSIFKKFYMNVSLKSTGKNNTQQGKRIIALLRWLQHETLSSAIEKIIGHVEKEKKEWIREQMFKAMAGYTQEVSVAYGLFNLNEGAEIIEPGVSPLTEETFNAIANVKLNDEEENDDLVEEDIESPDDEDSESDEALENEEPIEIDAEMIEFNTVEESQFTLPDWLNQKILSGRLPRYIVDLLSLRLYINSPQVENFLLEDAHQIAIPILRLIFTILHLPNKREFRYLTRIKRRTDIQYLRFDTLDIEIDFDCNKADNFDTLKILLSDFDNSDDIFTAIEQKVPADLRLLFVAIIYWSRYSDHFNVVYVSSLLLCQIALTVIDSKVEPIRNRMKFERTYKPQNVKKQPTPTETEASDESTKDQSTIETCLSKITKDDCILAQMNLLDLFLVSDKLRAKHTQFSSDIIHGFSEFQALVYQINCLNVLCGERYPNIEISKCFNGCFLYNMYVALKERPNIKYYIEKFLLPNSNGLFELYESMLSVLGPFVACLSKETISKRKKKRNVNKKLARERRKANANEEAAKVENTNAELSGSDFEDLNNKFSCLMRN